MINNRLIGELRIMKDLSIKPNFSALCNCRDLRDTHSVLIGSL